MSIICENADSIIDLWVRAGTDGLRAAGCPISQQLFLILLLKAEKYNNTTKPLQFNVKTTNLHKPHDEFKTLGLRHLPALVHGPVRLEHLDEIMEYLDLNYPSPYLMYRNKEADSACKDIFSKFCFYVKDVNKDPKFLDAELRKLDSYLANNGNRYLCDNELCYLDCEMLPKLHHVRLACCRLKNYKIPQGLVSFWKYLKVAYSNHSFRKSCPCDQEIILHWADRPDTLQLSSIEHKELSNQEPTYSFDVSLSD